MWRMYLWKWNIPQFQCQKFRPVKVCYCSYCPPFGNRHQLLINEIFFLHLRLDCSCQFLFLLAPCSCCHYHSWGDSVNKGRRLILLLLHLQSGWGGGFAEISDFPSDKCPADACPQGKYVEQTFVGLVSRFLNCEHTWHSLRWATGR